MIYKKQFLSHLCETHNALWFLEFSWFKLSGISVYRIVNKTSETCEEKDSAILNSNLGKRVALRRRSCEDFVIKKTKESLAFTIYILLLTGVLYQRVLLAWSNATPRFVVSIFGKHFCLIECDRVHKLSKKGLANSGGIAVHTAVHT